MTDPDETGSQAEEPRFDDPAYDGIRGLLADARLTEPMPADVAARLDETLAGLSAARRPASAETSPDAAPADPVVDPVVVPLRRRSKLAPRLLAAAAAVLVVGGGGIGISQLLGNESADLATATVAESDTAGGTTDFGPALPESAPDTVSPQSPPSEGAEDFGSFRVAALPRFTADGFTREAAAFDLTAVSAALASTNALKDLAATPAPTPGTLDDPSASGDGRSATTSERLNAYSAARAACPGPVGIDATLVPITFDGAAAALAVHPAEADGQLVEAWSCDGTTLLASTVVPR